MNRQLEYMRQRMADALDAEVGTEVIQIGRCRSVIRGTLAERERTKMLLLEMHHNPRHLRQDRREIRCV